MSIFPDGERNPCAALKCETKNYIFVLSNIPYLCVQKKLVKRSFMLKLNILNFIWTMNARGWRNINV